MCDQERIVRDNDKAWHILCVVCEETPVIEAVMATAAKSRFSAIFHGGAGRSSAQGA